MTEEKRAAALKLVAEMLPDVFAQMTQANATPGFADHVGELALENVFANIWSRPELDRRSRSLVTLGILIALRSIDELNIHTKIALRHGISVAELAEVIYQASGYAGFPAASSARSVMTKALTEAKAI